MLIELHMLQNFPPSNLNRDDIGQPKDCEFGGYRRARISSQCIKRSTRMHTLFAQHTGVTPSQRTKLVANTLTKMLRDNYGHPEADAHNVALLFARHYSGKMDTKDQNKTATLLMLSEQEIRRTVEHLHANWERVLAEATVAPDEAPTATRRGKKQAPSDGVINTIVKDLIRETKQRPGAPDIAMFGRMLADKPETNVDAACQVAHAISTHAVTRMEIDYFTAVDDGQVAEETGAGFLDIAYFTSACFYRYSCIDWSQLVENLKDIQLARQTVEAYLRASEAAIPSGKKNGTAPACRPSMMLVVVRQPNSVAWSLVNAFARPVSGKQHGIIAESAQRMTTYFEDLCVFYGTDSIAALALAALPGDIDLQQLPNRLQQAHTRAFTDWIATVMQALPGDV